MNSLLCRVRMRMCLMRRWSRNLLTLPPRRTPWLVGARDKLHICLRL